MSQQPHGIRVLVVHEYLLMCNIIAKVIDTEPDIQVSGFATSVSEAIDHVMRVPVDIVLVSPRLPANGTITLTKSLMKRAPAVRVLIVGISETREQVLEYIEAGACGYVIQESSLDDLLTIIRGAYAGKALISPEIALALIQRVKTLTRAHIEAGLTPPDLTNLTAREVEILRLISKNYNNQEIADELVIGLGTVKNHVHNILDKLGVASREEAAGLYVNLVTNWAETNISV